MRSRGTNDGGHRVVEAIATYDEEMAAIEALGPLTRLALYEAPLRWCALSIFKQVEEANLDPKEPRLDAHLARGILIESGKTIGKDRSKADALLGVKPIIPRKNTTTDLRVLRAERAAERRMRRFCR